MRLAVTVAGKSYEVDLRHPASLAIPLRFGGDQPNFFDAPEASRRTFESGRFVGDTRRGGSCNVAELRLVPHCNGTHTETAGHILDDDVPVFGALPQGLAPAVLVSVEPVPEDGDRLITRASLEAPLAGYAPEWAEALIVRTLPNDPAKTAMVYAEDRAPAYFAEDAMTYLAGRGVRHLLVDLPSVDRMHDDGRLANHRIFWSIATGARAAGPDARLERTITEMIFVDDAIPDGLYLLDLQIPAFADHAAPSRPVIYRLAETGR